MLYFYADLFMAIFTAYFSAAARMWMWPRMLPVTSIPQTGPESPAEKRKSFFLLIFHWPEAIICFAFSTPSPK